MLFSEISQELLDGLPCNLRTFLQNTCKTKLHSAIMLQACQNLPEQQQPTVVVTANGAGEKIEGVWLAGFFCFIVHFTLLTYATINILTPPILYCFS